MKKAKYIVIEGTEGVGKTTQVQLVTSHYKNLGKNVLETKEPGTPHNPLTMELRKIMLDVSYDLPRPARELISQAIRSIHLEKVVKPALESKDLIIQDRGMLSAVSYGEACENDVTTLRLLCSFACGGNKLDDCVNLYDKVIVLVGDAKKGLARATAAKQEFAAGDAMEMKGNSFMEQVSNNFKSLAPYIGNVVYVYVDGKSRETVLKEITDHIDSL